MVSARTSGRYCYSVGIFTVVVNGPEWFSSLTQTAKDYTM